MICRLCPRNCAALRTETQGAGLCRMPEGPVVARAALHMWEEPPISGSRGSGTIFFSGCSLGCVFCQNEKISHRDFGRPITLDRPGGPQLEFRQPHPLCPCSFQAADGAPHARAHGVELRGL